MIDFPIKHFIRYFPSKEDSCILTVGYDDFHFVKPLKTFRIQKFYTWHFILRGRGTLEIGGRILPAQQGQMFYISPDTEMRYYPDPNNPWSYIWFSLEGETAKEYGRMLGFNTEMPLRDNPNSSSVEMVLHRLLTGLMQDSSGYFCALSAFYEIMNICTSRDLRTGIDGVKHLIDQSFTLPTFQIDQLCRDVGISHAHLLRLFKEQYGMTLIKYVQKKRIDYACQLLLSTTLPIRSVATSCGYSDEIHFMKTFKKATGCSALAYRKDRSV